MTTLWIQITAGRGPVECQRGVFLVCEALRSAMEQVGCSVRSVDAEPGRKPHTLQSAVFAVEGDRALEAAATWRGTILWVCPSPYRPSAGRKNWYLAVDTFTPPQPHELREHDVVVETLRASGPGGQHVNKTESAVRMIHLPTGLTVVAREERSQIQNRKLAAARLVGLLKARAEAHVQAGRDLRWQAHDTLERGNPVRVFHGKDFKPA